MPDISNPFPLQLSIAIDRAMGFACALRAMSIYLQDFEAGKAEDLALSTISHGLSDALDVVRSKTNADKE